MGILAIVQLIDGLASLVGLVGEEVAHFQRTRDIVESLLKEGRDPTPDEFLALLDMNRMLAKRSADEVTRRKAAAAQG